MPGYLIDAGAIVQCPHQIPVTISGSQTLKVGGQVATVMNDTFTISGCPFMVGPKPQPCVKVQWLVAATRVTIKGQPALLVDSQGLCQSADQIPAGPPSVQTTQQKTKGT